MIGKDDSVDRTTIAGEAGRMPSKAVNMSMMSTNTKSTAAS